MNTSQIVRIATATGATFIVLILLGSVFDMHRQVDKANKLAHEALQLAIKGERIANFYKAEAERYAARCKLEDI